MLRRILVILVICIGTPVLLAAAQEDAKLSIEIIPIADGAGPYLHRERPFEVRFTNLSDQPIKLWAEHCRLEHGTLTFQIKDAAGTSVCRKRSVDDSVWSKDDNPTRTLTIPAGERYAWNVSFDGFFWGQRAWTNAPEPNSGEKLEIKAVFESPKCADATNQGVWTGRIESPAVSARVLDLKLQTPQQYLWHHCPKQALKLMQEDPSLINKRDPEDQCTPLHHAARFGFIDVVRWLLAHGAEVNAAAYNRFTPLYFADDPEIVKLLLEHGANANAEGASGTLLQGAAGNVARYTSPELAAEREKWLTIVKMLKEAGAKYDLQSACCLDDLERIKVLLTDKGAARNKAVMRMVASNGQAKIVKLLLEHGADPEDADFGGLTVSYCAIEHADVLKLLFDAGANPKVSVDYHGNGMGPEGSTLLHEAARRGCLESVKLLVARGVDINTANAWNTTALCAACRGGHALLVDWLIQNKAASTRGEDGSTPMSLAEAEIRPDKEENNARYEAVIRTLERAGAEVDVFAAIACNDVRRVEKIVQADPKCGDAISPYGCPALHRAVTLDRQEIARLLLEKGCDPEVRNQQKNYGHEGETALLGAAFWGRLEIAKMLIEHKANVNAKAADGVTPLHEASRMGNVDVARLLLEHGADPKIKNNKGETALDWIDHYKKVPAMVKLLGGDIEDK